MYSSLIWFAIKVSLLLVDWITVPTIQTLLLNTYHTCPVLSSLGACYNASDPRNKRQCMIRLRVKEVAAQKGLSMARLARRADIDYKTGERIFWDPFREMTTTHLGKLGIALEVPVTDFLVKV